jgi:hypothetical protein
MQELAEAFKLIFAKIGDFLDLFDLSFIVSGALMILPGANSTIRLTACWVMFRLLEK